MGFPQFILVAEGIFHGTTLGSDVNLRTVFKTEFSAVHALLPSPRPEPDTSASLCVHCCSLIIYKEKFHWMQTILQ